MARGLQSILDAVEISSSTTHIFINHKVASESAALLTCSAVSLPWLTNLGFSLAAKI